MTRFEDKPDHTPAVEVTASPETLRVSGLTYDLVFDTARASVRLSDSKAVAYAELSLFGGINTLGGADETVERPILTYEQMAEETRVLVAMESTVWERKTQVWTCRPESVEVYYELEGTGEMTNCTYFAGSYADETMSGRFASSAQFRSVFNPEPTTAEHRIHGVSESSSINVTGLSRAGMEDWFFTPAPYCFGVSLQPVDKRRHIPEGKWLMMGVAAPVEQQHFSGVHYDGGDGAFSLRLDYEGQTKVEGAFHSPSVLLQFADDPYAGLAAYAALAEQRGMLPASSPATKATFDWWREPIFCGWGAQVELGATDTSRTVQDFARQDVYDTFLAELAEHGLRPGTVTVDDKWQRTYGNNDVDQEKWPDLTGWIARRHTFGQKVLLWLKAWDKEGLPTELCVTTHTGKPVTVDPSNPVYEEQLRAQIARMLGPDGYDADGFKIDFTARTPIGRSLHRHGEAWGTSLLHRYLEIIYDQAKQTKPDALVVTHTPSPWFRDVTDMIRLNDINGSSSVTRQMAHRAKVARAACPEALIDTDNWPMPSIEEWRKYLRVQPKLGVAALYFTNMVAGQPLSEKDYLSIRHSWDLSRQRNGRVA